LLVLLPFKLETFSFRVLLFLDHSYFLYAPKCVYGQFNFKKNSGNESRTGYGRGNPTDQPRAPPAVVRRIGSWNINALRLLTKTDFCGAWTSHQQFSANGGYAGRWSFPLAVVGFLRKLKHKSKWRSMSEFEPLIFKKHAQFSATSI